MANGSMIVNGLNDDQFIKLLQIKEKSSGKLSFNLNSSVGQASQGTPTQQTYNNVSLSWPDATGAKFAAEVLTMLSS